ncbi:hypothetical protein E4U09_005709 [Claviceps aff. purpurea]|uniref:Uncharacterized protein n=1 Tax=Claviceps aff. purpurea TaxID=1967640 RepID=A0A9P7QCL9_9HYPO|nr:hypothetical protein E4U09_005709 [Claviceps aff. purpurea]
MTANAFSDAASKRPIADVQSPQAERTPSRHSAGPPHAESVAVRPRPHTPTRPAIKSAFLICDVGHLQYHRPGARPDGPGESSSQAAARNERERIQRHATIGLSGELLMHSLRHLPQRRVKFMRGIIVCQLRQCFSKVAALILTTSSNQPQPSHKLIELVNGAKSIVFRRDL